jgi:hypothetical protein
MISSIPLNHPDIVGCSWEKYCDCPSPVRGFVPSCILGVPLKCAHFSLGAAWQIISPAEKKSRVKIPLGMFLADKASVALFWCEGALSKRKRLCELPLVLPSKISIA